MITLLITFAAGLAIGALAVLLSQHWQGRRVNRGSVDSVAMWLMVCGLAPKVANQMADWYVAARQAGKGRL